MSEFRKSVIPDAAVETIIAEQPYKHVKATAHWEGKLYEPVSGVLTTLQDARKKAEQLPDEFLAGPSVNFVASLRPSWDSLGNKHKAVTVLVKDLTYDGHRTRVKGTYRVGSIWRVKL
jgi:hypothetical protein